MRVVLVTSAVTYVPENYHDALAGVLGGARENVFGLILIRNLELNLIAKVLGLYALGCRNFSKTLSENLISLVKDQRRKLFSCHQIPVLSVSSMNDESVVNWVIENKIDLIINMRTRCIYKKAILKAPRLGCINVHHGLLPENRGTMCDLHALAEGKDAGFSVHVMTPKIDAGDILHREVVEPATSKQTDYMMYLKKSSLREGEVLSQLINDIAKMGTLPKGDLNQTNNVLFMRNPTRARIRQMRAQGMQL